MNPYEYKTFNLSVLRHSTWNDTGDDDDDADEDQEDDDDDDDEDDDDDDGGGGDDDDDCNKYGSTSGLDETWRNYLCSLFGIQMLNLLMCVGISFK